MLKRRSSFVSRPFSQIQEFDHELDTCKVCEPSKVAMVITSRKRIILKLLAETGGRLNRLDLVKLAFLLSQEEPHVPATAKYDFVPYRRGPFSFTLYHDLSTLETGGLIESVGEHDLRITGYGRSSVSDIAPMLSDAVSRVLRVHSKLDTAALIEYVYSEFPFFTMNSEWEHRRAIKRPTTEPQVFTVGYEGLSLDALLNILIQNGIRGLIDVRANPVARRYGFHRTTLANICPRIGIEYFHRPELGIKSTWRSDLESQEDYDRLFERYENEVLPERKGEIAEVAALMVQKPCVMMCLEADPGSCHRTRLAKSVSQANTLPVKDLRSDQYALV